MTEIKFCIALLTGFISYTFGGFTKSFICLLIFVTIDWILGIIKGILNKSEKSKNGGLSSEIIYNGFGKKMLLLLYVFIGHTLDYYLGTQYIKDAVCIYFMVTELISITENIGILGVPLPPVIKNSIDILKEQTKKEQ